MNVKPIFDNTVTNGNKRKLSVLTNAITAVSNFQFFLDGISSDEIGTLPFGSFLV